MFLPRSFRKMDSSAVLLGKVYISGTGRAGTTFLIELFTELGLDTGFRDENLNEAYFGLPRAGLEWDLFDPNGPRFQKSPYLCDRLDELVDQGVMIDLIIVPVRDITDSAKSRIKVQIETSGASDGESVAGGLWSTSKASEQETVLRQKLTTLIEVEVRNDLKILLLSFPRLATDPKYTYEKLEPILSDIPYERFVEVFQRVSKPQLISKF